MSEIDELTAKLDAKDEARSRPIGRRGLLGAVCALGATALGYLGYRGAVDMTPDPTKCPTCKHDKFAQYPVGVLDVVKQEGNNFQISGEPPKLLIMLRICLYCHAVSENWVKKA